jgi:hypothetical protein
VPFVYWLVQVRESGQGTTRAHGQVRAQSA